MGNPRGEPLWGTTVTPPYTFRGMASVVGRCLNCEAELSGAFCAACGQRAVPPDPTVKELAGDAWQELTGYDGRIAATLRGLWHPGRLTIEYLRGHRAAYLPPVRVYLIASLVYFVIAAAAPPTPPRRAGAVSGPVGIRLGLGPPPIQRYPTKTGRVGKGASSRRRRRCARSSAA